MTKNDPAPRPSRVRAQYALGVDLRPGIFETMLSGKSYMLRKRIAWDRKDTTKNRIRKLCEHD